MDPAVRDNPDEIHAGTDVVEVVGRCPSRALRIERQPPRS